MRETVRDKGRLEHMQQAIERVLSFTAAKSIDDLSENAIEYYGIVKCIEIVGEAAYKLTPLFKDTHPDTPWSVIEKMRHVLVHGYYAINFTQLFRVITNDLPVLRPQIETYIQELSSKEQ